MEGKIMPYAMEAEQAVLGSIILDKDKIIPAGELLLDKDFYNDNHATIYRTMHDINRKGEPIDLITLTQSLRNKGVLEAVGGNKYLAALTTAPNVIIHFEAYCKLVKEKSILRKLIRASEEIMASSYEGAENIEDILNVAEKSIFDISQAQNKQDLTHISEVLIDAVERIQDLHANKGKITGISTGFIDLDKKINGLQKTDLILIAARPAMGKTAFTLNLAQNAAMKSGASVALFNLEMSKGQLIERMISAVSQVELNKIKNGNIDDSEWEKVMSAMGVLSDLNIHIDDAAGINMMELRSKCRRMKVEKGLDLVIIDYLQLMEGDSKFESRQQEISKISRSLKILAKELECPVIALSQLSRAPEQRADHRPILSDLRESGAIEQDADLVMFLYRDDYYNQNSEQKDITEVIISKHRHGEVGTVALTWFGKYQLFHNASSFSL
ncbi:MAG: replicative DNA helicase [Filifactoraceae bacterium]